MAVRYGRAEPDSFLRQAREFSEGVAPRSLEHKPLAGNSRNALLWSPPQQGYKAHSKRSGTSGLPNSVPEAVGPGGGYRLGRLMSRKNGGRVLGGN